METAIAVFNQIVVRIIKEQEGIIGPLAWIEAGKVGGITVVDQRAHTITLIGDPKEVIDRLVARYEQLFGRLSREVSREAVVDLTADIPTEDVPSSLK
jgi:hypothetical protein